MIYEQNCRVGTFAVPNPAVATTVTVGFKPKFVKVWNINDLKSFEHIDGLTAGSSIDTATDGTISINAAGSITLTSNGFTCGTDICDTAADVIRWVAYR